MEGKNDRRSYSVLGSAFQGGQGPPAVAAAPYKPAIWGHLHGVYLAKGIPFGYKASSHPEHLRSVRAMSSASTVDS